jgi:hypothetical protein
MDYLYILIRKYNKSLAVILILVILLFGAYSQLKSASNLIDNKKETYLQLKQGFEWIKENTSPESVIIGNGIQPYAIYYADRMFLDFPANSSGGGIIDKADYLVQHAFTPQSDYMAQYLQENPDKWQPVNVFFFNQNKTQVALVIYKKS